MTFLCGESMIKQLLRGKGIKVQRWRLRDSIHRVDSQGVENREKIGYIAEYTTLKGPTIPTIC